MANEQKLRELIAKWRDYAASTFLYGSSAETRGIEGAWRMKAKECADELEAALAESGAGQAQLRERIATKLRGCGDWDEYYIADRVLEVLAQSSDVTKRAASGEPTREVTPVERKALEKAYKNARQPLVKQEPFDARALELSKYIWQNVISLSSEPPKNVVAEVEHALRDAAGQAASGGQPISIICQHPKDGRKLTAVCAECVREVCLEAQYERGAAPATAQLSEEQVNNALRETQLHPEAIYIFDLPELTRRLNALLRSQPAGTKGDGG